VTAATRSALDVVLAVLDKLRRGYPTHDYVKACDDAAAEIRRALAPPAMLFGAGDAPTSHAITLPFIPPSLKNGKVVARFGNKAGLIDSPEHRKAKADIAAILEKSLRGQRLPLFGTDEVERRLVWDVQAGTVRVEWLRVAPFSRDQQILVDGRKRDLNSLGILVDDVAGKIRVRRQLLGPGYVYADDAQVCRASEVRV
jgi:hypothetical protein